MTPVWEIPTLGAFPITHVRKFLYVPSSSFTYVFFLAPCLCHGKGPETLPPDCRRSASSLSPYSVFFRAVSFWSSVPFPPPISLPFSFYLQPARDIFFSLSYCFFLEFPSPIFSTCFVVLLSFSGPPFHHAHQFFSSRGAFYIANFPTPSSRIPFSFVGLNKGKISLRPH